MTSPGCPTVVEAAARVRAGEQSAEELVRASLDAVAEHNDALNAFVHLDPDLALREARAVDAAVRDGRTAELGPLAGVPFGVKDLEDCAGMPTTKGSRWFAGGEPKAADSLHVGRLRAAGAIPIGKTATPEFGAWAYTASPLLGVTRNPWDPSRTPGGSSGGSSAAVSVGMVPFCTASDGGGSIRTPAAFTGLVGLRPSYGRIPTFGDTHLAQNAVVGSLTTTVADTALLLDVMAGPDPRDRTCLPPPPGSYVDALEQLDLSGLRVAWSADLGFAIVDPEVATIAEAAARAFVEATGAELVETDVAFEDYTLTYAFMDTRGRRSASPTRPSTSSTPRPPTRSPRRRPPPTARTCAAAAASTPSASSSTPTSSTPCTSPWRPSTSAAANASGTRPTSSSTGTTATASPAPAASPTSSTGAADLSHPPVGFS